MFKIRTAALPKHCHIVTLCTVKNQYTDKCCIKLMWYLYRHQGEILSCHIPHSCCFVCSSAINIPMLPVLVYLGHLCVSLAFVVGLNDSMSGGMQLLPDPLFSIPTDNTYILSITSTDLGRIFMAGKDGCLYEIAYQAEAGWLSQRCRKINHSKSSLSFLVPSVLQFSFSEDGKERDEFPCGTKSNKTSL